MSATIKFVIYTMVGSLLMLAAVIVYGLQAGTFSMIDGGTNVERLDLPRLRRRVRRQGAALPVPRLAARRLPRVAARGLGRPLRRGLEGGGVRLPADLLLALPGRRARLPDADPRARRGRARLRVAARVPRARHPRRDRVLVAGAARPDHARPVRDERPGDRRRRAADGQPRADLGGAVPARGRRSSGAPGPGEFDQLGGMARGRPGARDGADDDRDHRARRAGLDGVRGRVR